MTTWFEGSGEINCDIARVHQAFDDVAQLFVGVVALMPGLTTVELVDAANGSVTIRTNEGLMTRANISKHIEDGRAVLEYDEIYEAGSKVTTKSHFFEEFAASDNRVAHRLVMSDVDASGLLGFFYSRFGSSKTGSAFLNAYKTFLEDQTD